MSPTPLCRHCWWRQGFVFAGALDGLNENDPEQFYYKPVADKLG